MSMLADAPCVRVQVRMGFAHRNPDNMEGLAYIGSECKLGTGGYTCPRQGHNSALPAARALGPSPTVDTLRICSPATQSALPVHCTHGGCARPDPYLLAAGAKRAWWTCLQLPRVRPDAHLLAAPGALVPPPVPCQGLR